MKKKSIILLSGGLDSVVNFKNAYDKTTISLVLTFDYGQKAVKKEIEASARIAEKFNIPHEVISLDFINNIDSGLTKGNIPEFDGNKLNDMDYSLKSAKAVWVPNRNGIMINIAGAYADQYMIDYIITGFNKEEGATFPDNTQEFIDKINDSLIYSTLNHPEVLSYTIKMDKTEIMDFGNSINAPFEYVWSCYYGGDKMCGICESCQRLIRALKNNQLFEVFNTKNKWGINELSMD